jgi:hypothetical protein
MSSENGNRKLAEARVRDRNGIPPSLFLNLNCGQFEDGHIDLMMSFGGMKWIARPDRKPC